MLKLPRFSQFCRGRPKGPGAVSPCELPQKAKLGKADYIFRFTGRTELNNRRSSKLRARKGLAGLNLAVPASIKRPKAINNKTKNMEIIKSASKIAFLMLIATACASVLYEVIAGRVDITAENFMVLATAASSFYFAYKGNGKAEDFAGK